MTRRPSAPMGDLRVCALVVALVAVCASATTAAAPETAPPGTVNVFWNESVMVRLSGVTRAVALDDTVCLVEIAGEELRFTGRGIGDTVVFAWIDGIRSAILVHVAQKSDPPPPPTLSESGKDALGRGRAGMSVMYNGAGANAPLVTHEYWDWRQTRDGAQLAVRGFTNTYTGGQQPFNLASMSIEHSAGGRRLSVMDFTLDMRAADATASSLQQYGAFAVRGIDYAVTRGRNRIEFFAGNTVPAFFLNFAGTRSIVGAKLDRALSSKLKVFSALGVVAAPTTINAGAPRRVMPFETSGLVYRPSASLSATATLGISTRGLLGDVQADYARGRFAGSVAASDASSSFPLNRVQLLTAGESSVRGMGALTWSHVSLTGSARRTISKPGGLAVLAGKSTSFSQNINVSLPYRQQLSANVTRNHSSSTVLAANRNARFDGSWSAPIGSRVSNTFQGGVGRNSEHLQVNSYKEVTIRNAVSLTLPSGGLYGTFDYRRLDPSMLGRVRQVIDTLPSELGDLFVLDPDLFLQSVDLPPDVRQLLETVQPTSTSISVGGYFSRGKLSISPSLAVMSDAFDGAARRRSYLAGYTATWRLTSTWQLRSALSNRVFFDGSALGFRRSNVMTVGLDKSFTGLPRWLAPGASRSSIEGRVFRDMAVNGAFDVNDPGVAGVRVRLDDRTVTTTDRDGSFRFTKVAPGVHHLSIDLAQFSEPVRVTTPSEIDVEAIDRPLVVNFGIVNFARVIGTVFNDYYHDGKRQNDAPGLPRVRVRVAGGSFSTVVTSDSSGDYEAVNLPPGDYAITLIAEDLPADYIAAGGPRHVRVSPTATVVADVPVRALRSISGRVLLKSSADPPTELQPLAGVTLTAGTASATTDVNGRYTLRDLSAGLVEIRVVPVRAVPDTLQTPRGVVRLKTEAVRMENANIIISNADLLEYVTDDATSAGVLRPQPR